jgi:hypothetical protein
MAIFRGIGDWIIWDLCLQSYAIVTAVRETADAATIVAALAAARDVGAGTWDSNWILDSVVF